MAFFRNSQNDSLGVGANNVSYLMDTTKPLFSYTGAGIIPGVLPNFHWNVVQGHASIQDQNSRLSGLPGIVQGQYFGAPLVDTRGLYG